MNSTRKQHDPRVVKAVALGIVVFAAWGIYKIASSGPAKAPVDVKATQFVVDGLSRKVLSDVTQYGAPNCEDLATLIQDIRAIKGDTSTWEQLRDSTTCTHDHPWAGDSGE